MSALINDYELGSDPLLVGTGMKQYGNWAMRTEQGRRAQSDGVRVHFAVTARHVEALRFTSIVYLDQWYTRRDLLQVLDAIARQRAHNVEPVPAYYWVDEMRAKGQLRAAELDALLA